MSVPFLQMRRAVGLGVVGACKRGRWGTVYLGGEPFTAARVLDMQQQQGAVHKVGKELGRTDVAQEAAEGPYSRSDASGEALIPEAFRSGLVLRSGA